MPKTSLPENAVAYEDWIAEADERLRLAGVRREHGGGHLLHLRHDGQSEGRALFAPLQRAACADGRACRDVIGLASRDRVLPVVPLFHANGWSLAFAAPMAGATLVMPGAQARRRLGATSCWRRKKVTVSAAVPTVWLALLAYLEQSGKRAHHAEARGHRRLGLPARHDGDVRATSTASTVVHAWGMTEMSPLGSVCTLKPDSTNLARRRAATTSR